MELYFVGYDLYICDTRADKSREWSLMREEAHTRSREAGMLQHWSSYGVGNPS